MKCFNRTGNSAGRGLFVPGLLMAMLVLATAAGALAAGKYTVWGGCASGTNGIITNIIYGGGAYVCICSNKMIISSSNGTSWSTAFTATDVPTDVVYSGGKFYSCAGTNYLTSSDGAAWTSATFHGPNPNYTYTISAITCGVGGEMVAGGYSAILCSNDNGVSWVPLYLGAMQSYFGKMIYVASADQFVGLGSGGQIVKIFKTVDGSGNVFFNYTPIASTQTMYFTGLSYNPNPYSPTWYGIIVDNLHDYWISASKDLYTWNHIDSGKGDINGFYFNNGMAFGMGSIMGAMPTVDTSGTWSHQNINLANVVINDIAYGDSTYIAVGNNGVVFSSINGTSWTACSSGTTQNLNKVIFIGSSGAPKKLGKTAFAGGAFMAVGANGTIITANSATSINRNRRIEHVQADWSRNGRNAILHAYSIDGRELKGFSKSPAGHGPTTAIVRKRPGNGPSGLVVWH
jgi:hypothetical protein